MSSLKSEFSTESSTVFETEVTSWELTKSDLTRLKNSAPDSQDPIKYVRVNLNKSDSSSQYSLQLRPLQFVTGKLGAGYVTLELTEELYSVVEMVNMSGAKIIIFTKMESPFNIPSIRIIIFKPNMSKFAVEIFDTISSHCPMVGCKKNVGQSSFCNKFFQKQFPVKTDQNKIRESIIRSVKNEAFPVVEKAQWARIDIFAHSL